MNRKYLDDPRLPALKILKLTALSLLIYIAQILIPSFIISCIVYFYLFEYFVEIGVFVDVISKFDSLLKVFIPIFCLNIIEKIKS